MAKSEELYYKDDDGKRQDATLHNAILKSKSAEEKTRLDTVERGRSRGISEEGLTLLYL